MFQKNHKDPSKAVNHQLMRAKEKELAANRVFLKKIVETLVYLGVTEQSLRGHRDAGRVETLMPVTETLKKPFAFGYFLAMKSLRRISKEGLRMLCTLPGRHKMNFLT